ncbi:uncharacterized protein FPRO_10320 [Fusarium proliferatum ET1]|uniref:Uncharacterized protein n=1 Tax=Fusarium proliferatum (strain ET1) TaxID=1227346 RepID=A0A1L7VK96_FUSPR|nr:uncharacterized protein FPRO_10320 [Fusarium proliferatum ET1]CZR40732.1 uncharacterized protein FPRO_10320 [Fusarium proliferatum ET1]
MSAAEDKRGVESTSGADVPLAHGATLSPTRLRGPSEPSVYRSFHEEQMATEISSLKEENAKLHKLVQGQKQQMELILDMKKEQNQQMLDMKEQLASMQSELTQLRQAKEAPNHGHVLQSHPERPSLPETTVIVPDAAPRGPELGKNLSAPPNDDEGLEETVDVEPMQEDIASDQPVPKQKAPAEQRATTTQRQATELISGKINHARGVEDRTQEVSQLPCPSVETPSTNTEMKASTQSSDLPPWPVLPPNPPMPERNIARLASTGAGRFPAESEAHDVFVTPRSEVLKILKGYK